MKEEEIRPKKLFEEYIRLSMLDAERCFKNAPKNDILCPACGAENEVAFVKYSFPYKECDRCGTLYQSPRYTLKAYEKYYRDSESTKYWANTFFPAVAEARRKAIFQPRVDRIGTLLTEHDIKPHIICDVGAGTGIFLEEWKKRYPKSRFVAIEPSRDMAEKCRALGFEVIEEPVESVKDFHDSADLITCFELLEHIYDPHLFMSQIYKFVAPGGCAVFTTLGIDGFDIQILWEKSKSISPPHHINFFSRQGFEELFTKAGFTEVHITTPGELDVDIVKNMWKDNPDILKEHRFIQSVITDERASEKFQTFLKESNLSSHTLIFARK